MNIIYIHQYFQPKEGIRSFEFIKHLCAAGHKVTVITAEEVDVSFKMDNLDIISTRTSYSNHMSKMQRIVSFVKFMVKSTVKGISLKNTHLVYATSTPLTVGVPAVLISKARKCRMIFEVRDVWPDIPIEMGFITSGPVKWLLKKFELWIYKNANHIIPLSKGMERNIKAKGIGENKLTVIENIANIYLYSSLEDILDKREKNPFVCIHPGTMGIVNHLDFVLDTAKKVMERDKEIKFLLIGEGGRKEHLKARVENEKITNVEIKDAVPKKEIAKITESSSLGFMCVDPAYKILEDNSANKFFDFLAAGLPCVINYGGWQKEVLETARCGFSETDAEKMAERICSIKNNPQLAKEYGENARKTAERYSTEEAVRKLDEVLGKVFS